jgi:predicted porin
VNTDQYGDVELRLGDKMWKFGKSAALSIVMAFGLVGAASAADLPLPTKDVQLVSPASTSCSSLYDFVVTACPLTWYGVTFYGTIDVGGTYQTHGTPFDPNHPVGASYLLGNSATNAVGRTAGFGLGPNAMSQSVVGFKVLEPLNRDWSFIAQGELAFDPYSGLLANAPKAMFNAIGVPENQQLVPYDSSRWGWLAAQNYLGFSSPTYGTITFGRQNAPLLDAVNAYDPMGGSYAFSVIGNSGKTCGAGDTETCRWSTAIKYRENIGDFRLVGMIQPFGLFSNSGGFGTYNPNNGAVEGGIGTDFRHFGPGALSVDVFGAFEKDAVNWSTLFPGQTTANGWPTDFPSGPLGSGLKATISNNVSFMAVAKYSFGSWGNPSAPIVGKAGPLPSGPTGIPLTFYAGYEWIQQSNPSDPQSVFHDDGFLFTATNAAASVLNPLSGTTIANNAFNAACGSGTGCSNEITQVIWTGAKYGITRDIDLIGAYYHYIQNSYVSGVNCSLGNAASNSRCQGWFDAYSAVLDWRFLPKWDAYIGTMYSAAFGGYANGDISRNNLATTAGVRFRF